MIYRSSHRTCSVKKVFLEILDLFSICKLTTEFQVVVFFCKKGSNFIGWLKRGIIVQFLQNVILIINIVNNNAVSSMTKD